jgi:hypothetical protein
MPPSRKALEIDTVWIFWRAFLLIFLVLEWMLWLHVRQMPMRAPRLRWIIFLLHPRATRRSIFHAIILAGCVTLALTLAVQLIIRPLLNLWLRPRVDPSWWLFHLSSGDSPLASVPGRWKSDGRWQPGALVLTNRRIWFFPAAWEVEPWSMARQDLEQIEMEPSRLSRLVPIRNWPELLCFSGRVKEDACFAVADPDSVLGWFALDPPPDDVSPPPRIAPQGAFDA